MDADAPFRDTSVGDPLLDGLDAKQMLGERALSKLHWRSRRGLLENDLFIQKFFERHESRLTVGHARGMYDAGVIDKKTMRQFDEGCLTPVHAFSATEIKALREREEVSQTVFALYMNVSKDSVSQWERGIKKPAGPTLKLLSLVKQKGLAAIS